LTGFRARTRIQAQLIRGAFEMDLTRVVTLHFGGGEDSSGNTEKHGLTEYATRLELTPGEEVHSTLAHASEPAMNNPDAQRRFSEYCTFNSELIAELAHELNRAGLLGDTVILWTSSIGTGWHEMGDVPYVIIGGGNGLLKTGRYLNFARDVVHPLKDELSGPSHNQLLVSLCHAVGFTDMNSVGHDTISGYQKKRDPETGETKETFVRTVDITGPLTDLFG